MTYVSEVLSDSPLAYYRLGETSGTVMGDSSGNGRDGTYTGVTFGATGALAGDTDTAVTTAGVSTSHGDVAYGAWMNGLTALSVECWMKATVVGGTRMVWSRTGSTAFQYGLYFDASGHAAFNVRTSTSVGAISSVNVADGAWHHLVGTWDSATIRLYVDGTQAAAATLSGALATDANGLQVGGRGASYAAATIDEAAVYGTALSAPRIAAHYQAATAAASSAKRFVGWGVPLAGTA